MIIELFKRVPLLCISSWINHRLSFLCSPFVPFESIWNSRGMSLFHHPLFHPHPSSNTRSIIYSNLYISRTHIYVRILSPVIIYPEWEVHSNPSSEHTKESFSTDRPRSECANWIAGTHMQLLRLHLLLCPCCGTYRGLCFVVACTSSSAVIQEWMKHNAMHNNVWTQSATRTLNRAFKEG